MTTARDLASLINEVIADGQRTANPQETRVLSTNAVTRKLGLTARTVRFYSEVGIATPVRRGTTRLFTPAQVRRLELARDLRGIGMDVKSTTDLLDRLYQSEPLQQKLQALTGTFSSHLQELLRREEEVRQQYFVTSTLADELFAAGKPAAKA
jgi:DNA-binding transcriptional MerR regulator